MSYSGKVKRWSLNVGRSSNVHGIELLLNENIAAAASTGGCVRVYTASQGPSSSNYAQYDSPDAHNILWDPQRQVLWAIGKEKLVQLHIEGTSAAPTLVEVATTTLLARSGHDIEPNTVIPTSSGLQRALPPGSTIRLPTKKPSTKMSRDIKASIIRAQRGR